MILFKPFLDFIGIVSDNGTGISSVGPFFTRTMVIYSILCTYIIERRMFPKRRLWQRLDALNNVTEEGARVIFRCVELPD